MMMRTWFVILAAAALLLGCKKEPGEGGRAEIICTELDGKRFSLELDLKHPAGPGRYQVSVWGRYPGDKAFVMVSLRTIDVR